LCAATLMVRVAVGTKGAGRNITPGSGDATWCSWMFVVTVALTARWKQGLVRVREASVRALAGRAMLYREFSHEYGNGPTLSVN
jgi:hypothetical protein